MEGNAGLGGPHLVCDGLARSNVGEGSKDGAGVTVHDLTKVHGDCEQENEEEQGEVENCVKKLAKVIQRKEVVVHPEKDGDRQNHERPENDARDTLGPIGGSQGLLDKCEFGVRVFGIGLLIFRAHAGFLSGVRCLRRAETP